MPDLDFSSLPSAAPAAEPKRSHHKQAAPALSFDHLPKAQNPDAGNLAGPGKPSITQRDIASSVGGTKPGGIAGGAYRGAETFIPSITPVTPAEHESVRIGRIESDAVETFRKFAKENPLQGKVISSLEGVGEGTPVGGGGVSRAAAGLRSAMGRGSYTDELAKQRGIASGATQENPRTFYTSMLASGALTPAPFVKAQALGKLGKSAGAVAGGLTGAGVGAVHGALDAHDLTDWREVLRSASEQGTSGGALGGLLGGAFKQRPTGEPQNQQMAQLQRLAAANRGEKTVRNQGLVEEIEKAHPEYSAFDAAARQRMFAHLEGDKEWAKGLQPHEKEYADTRIKPLFEDARKLHGEVAELRGQDKPAWEDEGYVHRMNKAKTYTDDDPLKASPNVDPLQSRGKPSRLGTHPSSTQERKFYALEGDGGARQLIAKSSEPGVAFHTVKDGEFTPVPADEVKLGSQHTELEPGAEFTHNGKTWKMGQAFTREIEQGTAKKGKPGIEYHHDPMQSAFEAKRQANVALANQRYLTNLTQHPTFKQFAKKVVPKFGVKGGVPEGWRKPEGVGPLEDYVMHPRLANRLEDDWKIAQRGALTDAAGRFNDLAVRSMFFHPFPHLENVGAHAFTGRGWDWVKPTGYKRLVTTGVDAVKEVWTKGPKYREFLENGGSLIRLGIDQPQAPQMIAKLAGQDIEKNWEKWSPFFKTFGIKQARQATEWWYDKMNKALWSGGDMMMMQRYMENMQKGMPMKKAIEETERHIPNYMIPDEVLGSRGLQEGMTNPAFTMFSRYHYGMLRSWGETARGLYLGNSKEALDAAGELAATAFLVNVAYPLVGYGIDKLTGDEGKKTDPWDMKGPNKLMRGSAAVPGWLIDFYNGDKDFVNLVANAVTLSPALSTGLQAAQNRYSYSGQNIVTGKFGSPEAWGQAGEFVGDQALNPVAVASSTYRDAQQRGIGPALKKSALQSVAGMREPTENQDRNKQIGKVMKQRADQKRAKKPRGLIEEMGNLLR